MRVSNRSNQWDRSVRTIGKFLAAATVLSLLAALTVLVQTVGPASAEPPNPCFEAFDLCQ